MFPRDEGGVSLKETTPTRREIVNKSSLNMFLWKKCKVLSLTPTLTTHLGSILACEGFGLSEETKAQKGFTLNPRIEPGTFLLLGQRAAPLNLISLYLFIYFYKIQKYVFVMFAIWPHRTHRSWRSRRSGSLAHSAPDVLTHTTLLIRCMADCLGCFY